jgi:hypothetical protein
MLKKSLSVLGILLGGLLPILIYLAWHGTLGAAGAGALQTLSAPERNALLVSLLNLKPAYLLLCILLLLILWGRGSRPARAVFWGLAALLIGELTCGAVYAAFGRELIVSEHIHSYGMMLEFTFLTYALLDFLDRRVFQNHSGIRPTCAFAAAMGILASFLPLSVSTAPGGYSADLAGFPYAYLRFEFNQWVESRFLPVVCIGMFALACVVSLRSKQDRLTESAKIFFSIGAGLFVFAMLRLTLGAFFAAQLVWFEFWEEMTQFILVSLLTAILYHFQRGWFSERLDMFRS